MRTLTVRTPALRGPDITKLQTLLRLERFLAGPADGVYGPETALAVYKAKLALGYAKPDHAAGDLLLAYLEHRKTPTDAMKKRSAARHHATVPAGATSKAPAPKATVTHEALVRADEVSLMRLLLSHEPAVHYAQVRPMRTRPLDRHKLEAILLGGGSITMDCSESATLIARLAGAKDPNGRSYDGQGFTGTILATCKRIAKSELRPGDLVVFGPGTGHHVCTVLQAGSDPLLFSHGQEKGPFAIRLSDEQRYQAAPTRYLRQPI